MGTITAEKKKKGVTFRAEVRREGRRLTKRFARRTDARAWMAEIESKITRGEKVPRLKAFTVGDAIEKYLLEVVSLKKPGTQQLHRVQLEWFRKALGSIRLYKLTASHLSEAREALRSEQYFRPGQTEGSDRSPSTLNRYFQPLMHCLRTARDEWNWIQDVPRLKKLRENPARMNYYTPEEIRAVLGEIARKAEAHLTIARRADRQFSERMNLLITRVAIHTGARLSETCRLRWSHVDLVDGTIRFQGEDTKTGHDRIVPIPDDLRQDFIAWRGARDQWNNRFTSDYLFPALRASKKGYRSDFASKVFRSTARDLGIVGKTFHDIRHTAATWATRQGVPTRTVQALLGHQKISTTERYSHTMIEGQREAVEAISDMLEPTEDNDSNQLH